MTTLLEQHLPETVAFAMALASAIELETFPIILLIFLSVVLLVSLASDQYVSYRPMLQPIVASLSHATRSPFCGRRTGISRSMRQWSRRVSTNTQTGKSRGFGVVQMATSEEVRQTIASVNGVEPEGRTLMVTSHVRDNTIL